MRVMPQLRLDRLRPAKLRGLRNDPGGAAIEGVAAEFALLAQRRARIARQVDLLDRQLQTAEVGLAQVTQRMGMLARRIDLLDPDLRAPAPAGQAPSLAAPPPGWPSPYPPPAPPQAPAHAAPRLAAPGRSRPRPRFA